MKREREREKERERERQRIIYNLKNLVVWTRHNTVADLVILAICRTCMHLKSTISNTIAVRIRSLMYVRLA